MRWVVGLWVMMWLPLSSVVFAQRLSPADFEYLGAFAIDANYSTDNAWNAYGQRGMSFDAGGDPGNSDAFPGSLWVTGHDYENHVFELSIPTPDPDAGSFDQLPRPSLLTVPTQFTNGCSAGAQWFAGVEVHGSSLWGSCADWYNVIPNDLSVIWRRNLSDLSNLQGPFHAGPVGDPEFHSNRQGAYLFSIPSDFANANLGGKTLATGFCRDSHGGQMGPTILAFDPSNPANGYDLVWYRQDTGCLGDKSTCDYPGYTACDDWWGAAWVRTGEGEAVVIGGVKFDGDSIYLPGGWVCGPGFGEVIFYDPEDLAARVDGNLDPWEVLPYATWRPNELWGSQNALGGVAFDPGNGYLYLVEKYAGPYGTAIIHVYHTGGGSGVDYTLTVTLTGAGTGTVTSNPSGVNCGVDCQQTYSQGTAVQLTATPGASSYFAGWSGDADCSDGGVTLWSDRNCTARFEPGEPVTHTLSVSKVGSGSGTITSSPAGISCGNDCSQDYDEGSVVTLSAAPDADSYFTGWSGTADCTDGAVTLSADRNCVATFNEAPPNLGLVAAYGFEEGSGGTVTDASGQDNAGTLAGATWTSLGYFGNALSFDGVNDMVTIPDANSLDLTTGMTLEAWVRPASLSGWRTALLKESGSGLAYTLYAHDNAPQQAAYVDIGSEQSVAGGESLPLDTWSHLATTYDGTTLQLYVDGQQVGSRSLGGAIDTTNYPLRVGGNTVWGEYFEGTIDEIRVYDRALTQTEIQNDMNSPVTGGQQTEFALSIGRAGSGSGTVISAPAGIDCGSDCSELYDVGTVVHLSASPNLGSEFSAWTGNADCADGIVTISTEVSCVATFALDGAGAGDFCPSYVESALYRPRQRQVAANPSNWISVIEGAQSGDEVLLADGAYDLDQYAIQVSTDITIRSSSGNRDAVLIEGQGYSVPSEGFMILAPNVTLADLSMTGIRNHAVSIKGEQGADALHIYNVHLYDIGTQHIKGTPNSQDGVIACSKIGYTLGGVQGDYINAIDIHGATDYVIRDNEIYNIWGDGSGCEVDIDCGTYQPGGGPSIHIWNNASGNIVERNRILDSFRGIALGFGTDHAGGAVRNNFIFQSSGQQNGVWGDAGISIEGSNMQIDHNTVLLGTDYRGAIEVLNSSNLQIRNNLLSKPIWNRGSATYNAQGNKTDGTTADLVSPGHPHLDPASEAVDFPTSVELPSAGDDIDGDSRPQGDGPDAGCDEIATDGGPPRHALIVTRVGSGSGTVTSNPAGIDCGQDCAQDFDEGTVVQLTATATGNSSFTAWFGDSDCSDGQVTMNNARACAASFELLPPSRYTLIASRAGSGSGTVTSSPAGIDCGNDCAEDYDEGTVVQITATPDSDSQFVGWSGSNDCTDAQLTMNNNRSCTAAFDLLAPNRYTLSVGKTGTGSGTVTSSPAGIDCGNDCAQDYDEGTVVQLTTSPSSGSIFVSWSGDADCDDGQVTLSGNRNCTAAFAPENPFESKIVPGASSIRWKKAKLRRDYQSMVAVCNPEYSNNHPPLAVRIRNALRRSFEVKLERLDGNSGGISGVKVYCTVIEAGTYPESLYGVNIEAALFTSTLTDRTDSWSAETRSYSLAFSNPVVLGQVMTANDDRFSVFWSRGAAVADPPSSTELWVGKHVAEDPDFVRADESIGYIVIEAGNGSLGGKSYEAGVGEQIVKGYGNQPPYSYGLTGGSPHPHAAVSMAGMKNTDGGWANLYGDKSVSPFMLQLAVDEDQLQDLERAHPRESVAYIVFEPADSEIFWDDFESGSAFGWSTVVP